jgi:hypothetical protein
MDYELPTAEKSLRSAIDALERAEKIAKSSSDLKADWKRIFSIVGIANDLVDEAEKRDSLVAIDDHGPEIITCKVMRAKLLYLEATIASSHEMPEHTIQDGIIAFRTYLLLEPRDVNALNQLTRAYIRAFERENAISINRQTLQIKPSDFEAREIRDELRLDPNLGLKFSTKEPFVETPIPSPPESHRSISHSTQAFIGSVVLYAAAAIYIIIGMPTRASLIITVIATVFLIISLAI